MSQQNSSLNRSAKAVIAAAQSVNKSRLKVNPNGTANNALWDEIERKENRLLRAIERLAGLKRMSLGIRSSG